MSLTVDTSKAVTKLQRAETSLTADKFKPELFRYLRRSLTTAARETPIRSLAIIRKNQRKQYERCINYIPSFHKLVEPSLRVKKDKHWLYSEGNWYNCARRMPEKQWAQYQTLLAERNRRMMTSRDQFIGERAKARHLYRKSWSQVAESFGLHIPALGTADAETRRKPRRNPPRGYGFLRGGKVKLTADIHNPFLETESAYKDFTGKEIIRAAAQKHEADFKAEVKKKVIAILARVFK